MHSQPLQTEAIPDLTFVTPVYIEKVRGKLEHQGSAVLIRSTESYWLVTAAHVAAVKDHETIWLPNAQGGFFRLIGYPVVSGPVSPDESWKDQADLFCVALNDVEAGKLSSTGVGFLPLHPDTVDLAGAYHGDSVGVAWGFPDPSVTIEQNHSTVAPTYFHDLIFARPERLRRLGFDPEQNFALHKPRKFSRDGVKQHEFELRGLSGGAVLRSDFDGPRLVGIATEDYPASSLMICSRIGHLFASVAHHLKSGAPILKLMTMRRDHPTFTTVEHAVALSGADKNRVA